MAEEPTQVQTETTPAPTASGITEPSVPTPTSETAPVSTVPPAEEPSDSAGKAAGGVEGYLAKKDKAIRESAEKTRAQAAPPAATEETSVVEPATPAATTEEIPPVATTETPPASTTETAPASTVEDPDEGKKPDRIRIKGLPDGHLVAVATAIAREEGIPFEQAFERVKPKPQTMPANTETTLRSRADVEAEITTAKEERRNAAASADALEQGAAGKMVAAEEKLENLKSELEQIDLSEARSEQERERAERTQFSSTVSESQSKAVEYWPDAGVDGSDFSQRMIELSDQYEKDPRLAHFVYEADAPFYFAELVAKERGELPVHLKKKGAAPAPASTTPNQPSSSAATKPAPVNQRAVVRPVQPAAGPASGAARTTQEIPKDDLGVDKIRSVTDYEKVKKKALALA